MQRSSGERLMVAQTNPLGGGDDLEYYGGKGPYSKPIHGGTHSFSLSSTFFSFYSKQKKYLHDCVICAS